MGKSVKIEQAKYCEQGSTLIWAMCTLAILTIILSGVLAVAMSFYNTETNRVVSTRAELNARSGIELTAGEIMSENAEFTPTIDNRQVEINFDLNRDTDYECTVTATLVSASKIELSATSEDVEITAIMEADVDGVWSFVAFTTL